MAHADEKSEAGNHRASHPSGYLHEGVDLVLLAKISTCREVTAGTDPI